MLGMLRENLHKMTFKRIPEIQTALNKNEPITVTRDMLDDTLNKIIEIKGLEEVKKFREILKKSLIIELRSLPPSKSYGMLKFMTAKTKPLREQIIDAINESFEKAEKYPYKYDANGKLVIPIKITHPLVVALNDGTGIYGPNKQVIRPRNKKYMFIPGVQYAEKYYMTKYSRQKKSDFEAKRLFEYHKGRMTHAKAVRRSEKYSAIPKDRIR